MPFVRIDLQKGRDAAYRRKAGQIVYEALVSATGVPRTTFFRSSVSTRPRTSSTTPTTPAFIAPPSLFLSRSCSTRGARSTRNARSTGRSPTASRISLGLRKEDVFVNLIEVKKENWSFGNGIAQYAA